MALHQLNNPGAAAANFGAIHHGNAGSQMSHINQASGNAHQMLQPPQHHSSAGIGLSHDNPDLLILASLLQSPNQRMDGLDKLASVLAKTPARKLLCDQSAGIPGGPTPQM